MNPELQIWLNLLSKVLSEMLENHAQRAIFNQNGALSPYIMIQGLAQAQNVRPTNALCVRYAHNRCQSVPFSKIFQKPISHRVGT